MGLSLPEWERDCREQEALWVLPGKKETGQKPGGPSSERRKLRSKKAAQGSGPVATVPYKGREVGGT